MHYFIYNKKDEYDNETDIPLDDRVFVCLGTN